MRRTFGSAALVIALGVTTACGGGDATDGFDSTGMISGDSLVPIQDAATLPDTMPPAPAETVFVAPPPPPAASRPPAPRPSPSPSPSPAPAPAPAPEPVSTSLESGTAMAAVTLDSIHSRYNQVGDPIRVRVSRDVSNDAGRVIIPAGSVITMSITEIGQANNKGDMGTLVLSARNIVIDGVTYPVTARATDFEYEMRARGVGASEVARTGGGAVAGAIIGRVIGGKTGTVVGAVGGAAAGAAIANETANRDIIVTAGKNMTITLRDDFSRN